MNFDPKKKDHRGPPDETLDDSTEISIWDD
jgi:hypothetical protein